MMGEETASEIICSSKVIEIIQCNFCASLIGIFVHILLILPHVRVSIDGVRIYDSIYLIIIY
jgi:hypothetical protein